MAIELRNICKSYGDKQVLKNVNLTINPGEITCIMGASGIGKTTLINIIAGLVKPDAGEIAWHSNTLETSIVFQEDRLLNWETALSNVLFVTNPASEYTQKAKQLLTQAGLADSINKKTTELSGGMKRRVCICRALIANYDLLILDEPFKGLDNETKPVIMTMIKEHVQKDKYVICITHDYSEVEFMHGRLICL